MEHEVLLSTENVKVYFKGKKEKSGKSGVVKAVDDISLYVYKGETLGIVGESGCGKSTFGRAVIRLLEPTGGKVYFRNINIADLNNSQMKEMRKKVQIIFQDPSACLNPRRTVQEILEEPFAVHGIKDKNYKDERIAELIGLVGLSGYHLSRYPHELSGGQKQRIGIARALALNPDLVVCDEAVSALDVSVQAQVINLLEDLQKELGLTYIFISHNLNVIHQVSDRVGVMYLGRMVEVANCDDLYEKKYHPYTQALLSAIPQLDADEQGKRIILQGEVPSPSDPPKGCHFHTRCPRAFDRCFEEAPELIEIDKEHYVACHLYNKPEALENQKID